MEYSTLNVFWVSTGKILAYYIVNRFYLYSPVVSTKLLLANLITLELYLPDGDRLCNEEIEKWSIYPKIRRYSVLEI